MQKTTKQKHGVDVWVHHDPEFIPERHPVNGESIEITGAVRMDRDYTVPYPKIELDCETKRELTRIEVKNNMRPAAACDYVTEFLVEKVFATHKEMAKAPDYIRYRFMVKMTREFLGQILSSLEAEEEENLAA